jgi:hypothetical protein
MEFIAFLNASPKTFGIFHDIIMEFTLRIPKGHNPFIFIPLGVRLSSI